VVVCSTWDLSHTWDCLPALCLWVPSIPLGGILPACPRCSAIPSVPSCLPCPPAPPVPATCLPPTTPTCPTPWVHTSYLIPPHLQEDSSSTSREENDHIYSTFIILYLARKAGGQAVTGQTTTHIPAPPALPAIPHPATPPLPYYTPPTTTYHTCHLPHHTYPSTT